MRSWVVAVALLGAVGCEHKPDDVDTVPVGEDASPEKKDEGPKIPYVPAGDLRSKVGVIKFAVYAMPGPNRGLVDAAKDIHGRDYGYLQLVEGVAAKETPSVLVVAPPMAEFAPPSVEELRQLGMGITAEQAQAVQSSPEAVVLAFAGTPEELPKVHRGALKMTQALANQVGGLVWDEDTQQLFSEQVWAARVESDPFDSGKIGRHFVIRSVRKGEFVRQVTSGMTKYALPDIMVDGVPPSLVNAMSRLLNLVAATMVAQPVLAKEGTLVVDLETLGLDVPLGAEPKVEVTLTLAKRGEGDPENRVVEISFVGDEDKKTEQMAKLLAKVTGAKDKVSKTPLDPAIVQASLEAKKKLERIKPAFQKGLAQGETLMVKAPFETRDKQLEWMWVEVLTWDGETLSGVLQNEPRYVANLEAGSKVQVVEGRVFDYIHKLADGTVVGNETGKLMAKKDARIDAGWSAGLDPFAGQKKIGE